MGSRGGFIIVIKSIKILNTYEETVTVLPAPEEPPESADRLNMNIGGLRTGHDAFTLHLIDSDIQET